MTPEKIKNRSLHLTASWTCVPFNRALHRDLWGGRGAPWFSTRCSRPECVPPSCLMAWVFCLPSGRSHRPTSGSPRLLPGSRSPYGRCGQRERHTSTLTRPPSGGERTLRAPACPQSSALLPIVIFSSLSGSQPLPLKNNLLQMTRLQQMVTFKKLYRYNYIVPKYIVMRANNVGILLVLSSSYYFKGPFSLVCC